MNDDSVEWLLKYYDKSKENRSIEIINWYVNSVLYLNLISYIANTQQLLSSLILRFFLPVFFFFFSLLLSVLLGRANLLQRFKFEYGKIRKNMKLEWPSFICVINININIFSNVVIVHLTWKWSFLALDIILV